MLQALKVEGIIYVNQKKKFDIMELIYTNNDNANIIIQEFIETSYRKDLRVFIIGGKVVGCTAFELTLEAEWMATEASRLLNLDVVGVDLLFGEDGIYLICEANSLPQFHGQENVVGQRIADDILDYVLVKNRYEIKNKRV